MSGGKGTSEKDGGQPAEAAVGAASFTPAATSAMTAEKRVAMDPSPDSFRVIVAVRECRELVGSGDAVDLNPFVRITIGEEMEVTKTMSKTADPNFDQTFNFDFPSIPPAALFEQTITLEVMDSGWVSNSEIGSYRFDVGNVYSQPGHQYANQWVELNHRRNSDGATGYMQVTVTVLGAGERAPVVQDNDEDPENFAQDPRVLRPNKVTGVPCEMTITVYAADNLPQMDATQLRVIQSGFSAIGNLFFRSERDQELDEIRPPKAGDCDPYFKCTFGGPSLCTKVKDNTQDPRFDDGEGVVVFPIDLPSTATNLKIEAMDSDSGLAGNSDDTIGTARLDISKISSGGKGGFGPSFGPGWINLWGQSREMDWTPSVLQSEHMAHMTRGLVEGCDYRGRVLVEISTTAKGTASKAKGEKAKKRTKEVLQSLQNSQVPYECRVEVLSVTMIDRRYRRADRVQVEAHMNPVDWDNEFDASDSMRVEKEGRTDDDPYFLPIQEGSPVVLGVNLDASSEAEGEYWAYNVRRVLIENLREAVTLARAAGKAPPESTRAARACLETFDKLISVEVAELASNPPRPPTTVLGKRSQARWRATLNVAGREVAQYRDDLRGQGRDQGQGQGKGSKQQKQKQKQKQEQKQKGKKGGGDDDELSELRSHGSRGGGGRGPREVLDGGALLDRLNVIATVLGSLVHRPPHEHVPDLVVRVVSDGEVFGYVRIRPEDIVHSNDPSERGPMCDRAQSFVLKSLEQRERSDPEIPALVQLRAVFGASEGTPDWPQPRRSSAGARYQLRCYVYQAEALLSADEGDESDVYFRVTCGTKAGRTITIQDQNDPQHDYTVILDDIFVPDGVKTRDYPEGEAAPEVVVEAFDEDDGWLDSKDDYLGRAHFSPVVRGVGDRPVALEYYDLDWHGANYGRVLMAAELIHMDDIDEIPIDEESRKVPSDIAPRSERYRVIVRPLGLRNLKPSSMFRADRPHVRLEVAGGDGPIQTEQVVSMSRYPNFQAPPPPEQDEDAPVNVPVVLPPGTFEVGALLPVTRDAHLAPRLTFKVLEKRAFGSVDIIGRGSIDIRGEIEAAARRGAIFGGASSGASGGGGGGGGGDRRQRGKEKGGRGNGKNGAREDPRAGLSHATGGADEDESRRLVRRYGSRNSAPRNAGEHLSFPSFDDPGGRLATEKSAGKDAKRKVHDWWSKFLNSSPDPDEHDEQVYDGPLLRQYDRELESVFPDMSTIIASHDVMRGNEAEGDAECVGQLVMGIAIFPSSVDVAPHMLPWHGKDLDLPTPVIVRVYVVRALELRSTDEDGLFGSTSASDPYIQVKLGGKTVNNRSEFVQNNNNPEFGRLFEMEATIPKDTALRVQIMDQDAGGALLGNDDMIGETLIDIEQRFLSERHASCPIAECHPEWKRYWRDNRSPFELLREWARFHALKEPVWDKSGGDSRRGMLMLTAPRVGEVRVTTDDLPWLWNPEDPDGDPGEYLRDSFALHAIHEYTNLMAECVERRALFSPARGEMVQGYVDMWIDIFEVPTGDGGGGGGDAAAMASKATKSRQEKLAKSGGGGGGGGSGKKGLSLLQPPALLFRGGKAPSAPRSRYVPALPPPVALPLRKPIEFELRMIVHRVQDVIPDETSFVGGQKMSDIFVRAFVLDHANRPRFQQDTDVHYRSLNGEGLFNWRMIFPVSYDMTRNKFVWQDGGALSKLLGTQETRFGPACVVVQLWDADTFSASDFLGYARIDLTKLSTPKTAQRLKAGKGNPYMNLFERHETPNSSAAMVRTWVKCHGKFDPAHISEGPNCCQRCFCRWNCLCCTDMTKYDSDNEDDFLADGKALPWEGADEARKRKEEYDKRVDPSSVNRTGKKPKRMVTGRAELEFELLTKDEAELNPAGKAHDPPQPMPEPIRPKDSFYALTSPLKSLYYVIWVNHRVKILILLLLAIVGVLVYHAAITYPQIFAQKTSDWLCFGKCEDAIAQSIVVVSNATSAAA